jgi:hypothetical protein
MTASAMGNLTNVRIFVEQTVRMRQFARVPPVAAERL